MKPTEEKVFTIENIPEPENIADVIYSLMVNPNLASINYFNDFSEGGISPDLIGNCDTDESGIFTLESDGGSMAMGMHAFHHHLSDDPQKAVEILVSRATRKMLCLGANPLAVSALLYHIDFAHPNGHMIASGAKKGLENAASKFGLKISDRKIRFDHFLGHAPMSPTIIISIIASVDKKENLISHRFKTKGNNIFMIGRSQNDIGLSEYLEFYHNIGYSLLPAFDIETEKEIHKVLRTLHASKLISSASPVGRGGLFFTLLRAAIPNSLGFDITTDAEIRKDAFLFGEAMGRIVVDVETEKEDDFVDTLTELKFPFFTVGHVTRGEIRIDDESFGYTDKMTSGT
jgi:phosphoribosylformylglycinamidine synthase subunit PurL